MVDTDSLRVIKKPAMTSYSMVAGGQALGRIFGLFMQFLRGRKRTCSKNVNALWTLYKMGVAISMQKSKIK
jgi:hypothetical protein